MNTDKHGLKKYFVVLKKTKNGVGMGSVYFSENQWPIKKENKFGMGSWVISVFQCKSVAN